MPGVGFIAKVIKGAGFRGVLDYTMDPAKRQPDVRIVGNMAGTDPRSLAREFGAARVLRPDVVKPVFHSPLSLPGGADLDDRQWETACRIYLKDMGIDPDKHQWVAVPHADTNNFHRHVIASRISIVDGSLARERRGDYRQSHAAAAAASRAVGLAPVIPAPRHERKATVARAELAHAQRAREPHPKLQIAARLDAALALSKDLAQFKAVAEDHGIDVKFSSNSGGIYGVSYRLAGPQPGGFAAEFFKGSQISKAHTLPAIMRRLAGEADTPRDRQGMRIRQDILTKLTRETDGDRETVRWANGYVAVVATHDAIHWRTTSAASSRVAAAIAAERGYLEMLLADRGDEVANRVAVNAYLAHGITVNLAGRRYEAETESTRNQHGNDERSQASRTEPHAAAGHPLAAIAGATGRDSGAAEAATADAGQARRAIDAGRQDRRQDGTLDSTTEEKVMDALDFLNETETTPPPPAPAPAGATTAAPRSVATPRPSGPVPTPEDHANALNAALALEMSRRRWAPSSEVARELEGRRQELEWHQMQSWSRRLMATARGQQALLRGEIQRLEQAHKQALAREKGLRQYLKSDPISSSLLAEEAQNAAKERAERFEEAARAAAAREAQAEAVREAALQREREALRQRDAEKDDETPRPKKKSGGAPKPR